MLSFESFVADREPVSVALGGTKEEEVATGSQGLLRFFCRSIEGAEEEGPSWP